jgi:hypothetical protein
MRAAGAEALSRFADFDTQPRASYAEAFAHRFPAQLSRAPLAHSDPDHLIQPGAPTPSIRRDAQPLSLDLGI